MNGLQDQIVSLNHKVDQLHEIVGRLSTQLTTLVNGKSTAVSRADSMEMFGFAEPSENSLYASIMDHKDVLPEYGGQYSTSNHDGEKVLSADTQIRRLTAQLTAAYNRIAALEERLLTYRVHS